MKIPQHSCTQRQGNSPIGLLFFCFLFSMFAQAGLQAQVNADSLRLIWEDNSAPDSARFSALYAYYVNYTHIYPDTTLELTDFHFALAQEKGSQPEMLKALNERAIAFSMLGKAKRALPALKEALALAESLNDSTNIANICVNLGNSYRDLNLYQQSVRYYSLSLGMLQATDRKRAQADVLNNLGLVYEDIELYDLALEYLHQALIVYNQAGVEESVGNIWLNIGAVHQAKKEYKVALRYYRKAEVILTAEKSMFSLADCHYYMASAFQELGQPDSALFNIQKSMDFLMDAGHEQKIINTKTLYANLILEEDLNTATRIAEEVVPASQGVLEPLVRAEAYALLYKCYKAQGKHLLALQMLENHLATKDSMRMSARNMAVVREAIQSEFKVKLFNSQLEDEKARAQLKLNQVKWVFGLLLFGIVLIFLLILYSRARINRYRTQKDALLAEIEKLKAAGNTQLPVVQPGFHLDRKKIEVEVGRKLNETDWTVLNILLNDPVISNKGIAEKAFLTVDGIGSSLKRMYALFDVKESKYKKISLLMDAMKISSGQG